ncbi:cation transport protein-domain-containing protein [Lasiosphaeris hirsuta]|uniref:Potassium transport protein n=1 Tax=Lasiosphaeris hirsuta TaxID=260670 RepID=A0AA39ZRM1_9PEZI|nr:cation transport protein-domain-containing protein [Lasiosphaeris hirsuta]
MGRIGRFFTACLHLFAEHRSWLGWLPPLNFITIHYAYFIVVPIIASAIFWGSSNPKASISYVDSLFLTVSAMTEAGLNTVNLSQMTTWQQVLLWLLIPLGSTIWVSIWTVLARKHVFERRFTDIVRANRLWSRERRGSMQSLRVFGSVKATTEPPTQSLPTTGSRLGGLPLIRKTVSLPGDVGMTERQPGDAKDEVQSTPLSDAAAESSQTATDHIAFAETPWPNTKSSSIYQQGNPTELNRRNPSRLSDLESETHREPDHRDASPHLHVGGILHRKIGRNAQFHDLTRKEREKLGGCEYQALKLLAVVIPIYFVLWQLLGAIALGAWIANHKPDVATSNGSSPWFAGIFFAISAFNNSGMALLDANMVPFQESYFMLITMGLLILAGNTAYPLFLRLIFWSFLKVLRLVTTEDSFCAEKATLEFILTYPRRVYTNLFPARQTWWLFLMLILLNGIDWVAFEVLNIGNSVIEQIPPGARTLDGLFQALAVRSGGFYVIPISSAYIGLQFLYVIMMYISVYPVVITMRHSNVYEERSLGIYDDDQASTDESLPSPAKSRRQTKFLAHILRRAVSFHGVGAQPPREKEESHVSFINQQIRGQLAHDLWWLVLAVLIITIIETKHFLDDPVTYSVFNIVFEVVSAYGCVGISIGLPTQAYSFSGGWHPGSKLVLVAVMLRGRHRGLPVALDRAVRLPGYRLHQDEEEDYQIRRVRSKASRRAESIIDV